MGRGGGGGGRGGGAGKSGGGGGGNPSDYGGIETAKNVGGGGADSFVSHSDPSRLVKVSPITEGASDRQIQYAGNQKRAAMQEVDRTAADIITNGKWGNIPVSRANAVDWRNRLMGKINGLTDARTALDSLVDRSGRADRLAQHFGEYIKR